MKATREKKTARNTFSKRNNVFLQARTNQPFLSGKSLNAPSSAVAQLEAEADQVADAVVHDTDSKPHAESVHGAQSGFILPGGTIMASKKDAFIQRKCDDEYQLSRDTDAPFLQPKSFFPANKEQGMVQLKSSDGGTQKHSISPVNDYNRNELHQVSGSGQPFSGDTKDEMESAFNHDFSQVKIHKGTEAAQMSKQLNAKAFTHGNNIYFSRGAYNPDTKQGKHLLAHELTHTIQQSQIPQSRGIQKKEEPEEKLIWKDREGELDLTSMNNPKLTVARLKVPNFKKDFHKKENFKLPVTERSGRQAGIWDKEIVADKAVQKVVENKIQKGQAPDIVKNGKPVYYWQLRSRKIFVAGDIPDILPKISRPFWTRGGTFTRHHVDHKEEYQLGGADEAMSNMWLLDESANTSSGANIKNELDRNIEAIKTKAEKELTVPIPEIQKKHITIAKTTGGLTSKRVKSSYTEAQVKQGETLVGLRLLDKKQIKRAGLQGSPNKLVIYTNKSGGGIRHIKWGEEITTQSGLNIPFGKNFEINSVTYKKGEGGQITGTAFEKTRKTQKIIHSTQLPPFDITESELTDYGGYISQASVNRAARKALHLKALSPVNLHEVSLDPVKGLVGKGKIDPTIPLLSKANIDISIDGDEISATKVFNPDEFALPYPFSITDTSLAISIGTKGLNVSGEVNFEIARVGRGILKASGNAAEQFGLEGTFDFDSRLFNPAQVKVWYADNAWGFEGTLGIQKGVKGVKDANITIGYLNESLFVNGFVNLDIPKVKAGILVVNYSKEQGLMIRGGFTLDAGIKGIKNAAFSASLAQKPGEENYRIKAGGTIDADIPGLKTTTIKGAYDDGLFLFTLKTGYSMGIVDGELELGVSNQKLDENNRPTGEETENLVFWGGAMLEVVFADKLKGVVAARVTPEGEVILSGGIKLPETIPLTKDAFKIRPQKIQEFPTIKIPIGPSLSVLGKDIGIFLQFGGHVCFQAGIGPVMLKNLYLELESFNPREVDQAKVKGGGELSIPAYAELKLVLFAGVKLSVVIVKARGDLNGSAALILKGEAGGEVHLEWSKADGLKLLKATGELDASVKLLLSLFLTASVEVDLLLTSFTAWSDKWDLLSAEIGTPLNFGLKFPVDMQHGRVKEINFDDLERKEPRFDRSNLENLLKDGADKAQNPPKPPPPSKDEVLKKLRRLPPGFKFDFFDGSGGSQRWGYIFELQFEYPDQNWWFAREEAQKIDQQEVETLKNRIQRLSPEANEYLVMGMIGQFKKKRVGVELGTLKPILEEKGFHTAAALIK